MSGRTETKLEQLKARAYGPYKNSGQAISQWRAYAQALEAVLDYAGPRVHEEPVRWQYARVAPDAWVQHGQDARIDVLADTPGNIEWQRKHGYLIVKREVAGPWQVVPDAPED